MNYSFKKSVFVGVIITFCCYGNISLAIEPNDNAMENYNKQIVKFLKQNKCNQAESIAKQAEKERGDSAYLLDWYHLIIECHKKQREGWGDLELRINDFINKQLDGFVESKGCGDAEIFLNKIEKKFYAYWRYESGLYKVARCYESTDTKKSEVLYQRLMSKYPKSDEAREGKQRLSYLSGNRAWIYAKSSTVIDGVKTGLQHKDIEMLEKYASKSSFQIGFEDEWSPEQFSDKGKDILRSAFERSEPLVGPLRADPHRYTLLVVFPAENHPFWYFEFKEMEGGWQWTGIIISNVKKIK